MLATKYRLAVYNNSGGAVTPTVRVTPWKYGSDGAVEYQTEQTPAFGSIGNGAVGVSGEIDNATVKAIGAHGIISFPIVGGATGDAIVYLQQSSDGTNWAGAGAPESDELSNPIASVNDFSAAAKDAEFEV